MVITKVSEVFSKGYEWAASGSSSGPPPASDPGTPKRSGVASAKSIHSINKSATLSSLQVDTSDNSSASDASFLPSPLALWDAASSSLSTAADQAYSSLAVVANSAWEFGDHDDGGMMGGSNYNNNNNNNNNNHEDNLMQQRQHQHAEGHDDTSSWLQSMTNSPTSQFAFGSPWNFNKNPYNRVRGRYSQNGFNSSLSAVRSLLPLVADSANHEHQEPLLVLRDIAESQDDMDASVSEDNNYLLTAEKKQREGISSQSSTQNLYEPDPLDVSDRPIGYNNNNNNNNNNNASNKRYNHNRPWNQHQNSETASQLAEGSVRALRDIALDEAVEFHAALRYWSDRWEDPMLSWLEAGPTVWSSRHGYNHQVIGQKVAKIQAVLARRCAVIGELQQHLLRAGWQRGVAQWGVLGQGGQWATVQCTYVMTEDTAAVAAESLRQGVTNISPGERRASYEQRDLSESLESMSALPPARPISRIGLVNEPYPTRKANQSKSTDRKAWNREKGYYASVFVRNEDNGQIHMNDAALAEWSVDAMALIRNLLERASNGEVTLPYEHHWKPNGRNLDKRKPSCEALSETSSQHGELIIEEEEREVELAGEKDDEGFDPHRQLPVWAKWVPKQSLGNSVEVERLEDATLHNEENVVISNLPLMAAEVTELLNSIEDIMSSQRNRRMKKLRPPSMFRRRWYLTAFGVPIGTYVIHHLVTNGYASKLINTTKLQLYKFFQEHVVQPFMAIIKEVWKGREDMSDKKARIEVIAGLKEMIRSWLDENYPDLPEAERMQMAELMDITLIEQKKAECMKTIYELNQAVRLSFIEMQFIKKEMVNALYTMDEMVSANDINMNLAAVTPAVLLLYSAKQVFRFFYYALLKLGKSREETYATFRQILTDIERLLTMRDNPPSSPFPLHQLRQMAGDTEDASQSQFMQGDMGGNRQGCDVLSADDLGMLMLHIHECRTILWRDYNRFTPAIIQSVSEDLAELAGERGAVSVQQQLQIISRMCRTYPFLKVISIGTTFHQKFIGV